ncbi:NAD-dependent epimerase/dehydratase family protein [Aestuariibius sp. 2305UL40-4]|uniref:NAD-dependent epimerase/dehydratase family protein n=1 Tax=Aestuariibius violaceus TaxID=3234132 RepID=UPI00346B9182
MSLNVFVLGGTGLIGRGVVRELTGNGHTVIALSRSPASDKVLQALGARPVRGDMREPAGWRRHLNDADAFVQVAATFGDDMGAVDAVVIDALEEAASKRSEPLQVVYTGGCWLYGATGDEVADEERPFSPIPAFAWMVNHAERLAANDALRVAVIHPAMVYATGKGVFERFVDAARDRRPIQIWGAAETRWPLVHRDDLAVACRLVLEAGLTGHYNASAEVGVPVSRIAAVIAERARSTAGIEVRARKAVVAEHGDWAVGSTLDQRMSSERLRRTVGWVPRFIAFEGAQLF